MKQKWIIAVTYPSYRCYLICVTLSRSPEHLMAEISDFFSCTAPREHDLFFTLRIVRRCFGCLIRFYSDLQSSMWQKNQLAQSKESFTGWGRALLICAVICQWFMIWWQYRWEKKKSHLWYLQIYIIYINIYKYILSSVFFLAAIGCSTFACSWQAGLQCWLQSPHWNRCHTWFVWSLLLGWPLGL